MYVQSKTNKNVMPGIENLLHLESINVLLVEVFKRMVANTLTMEAEFSAAYVISWKNYIQVLPAET
jgi:hypothetical protein